MKLINRLTMIAPSISIALVFVGCAAHPKIGERTKVGDSGKQPSWVRDTKDGWEKGGRIFFRSLVADQSDLSMGLEASKAKGIKEISEKVNMRITSDLGYIERGNSSRQGSASRFLISAIAAQTEQLELSGFEPEETYWERFTVTKAEGVDQVYDIYRSFSIKKSDYEEAKARVLNKGRELAQAALDKKAEEELEDLLKKNSTKTN